MALSERRLSPPPPRAAETAGLEVTRLPYQVDCRVYFAAIRDLPWPVWLDSGFPRAGGARHYDVITADPFATLERADGRTRLWHADRGERVCDDDPLVCLRGLLGDVVATNADVVFPGGAVGYLGYDLARDLGTLAPRAGMPGVPEAAVGVYDWALVVDHDRRRSYVVRQGRDTRPPGRWREVVERLRTPATLPLPAADIDASLPEPGMPYVLYRQAFERIQRYIRDGDCYQVNLAQRFRAETAADAWTLYQRMRHGNPAPYAALLEYPFGQVLSSSPEQFLSVRDGVVQTRPIKGTRPRGATPNADAALRAALLSSTKDRAENLMIVDLLRNDLGRVCEPGSIDVPGLFQVESFATVHHLVSTVTGRLAAGSDALDLIAACFPGGSITGAPKRRAMQIIDELETVRREVYCGNVIRLGFDGNLDSSITIRTALLHGHELYYWAGGGIVAESDCAAEYQESLDKAAAFLRLIGQPLASFQRS
ncbi:MAG: aminodeoxychorismate synthase component I [Gammaproteobacteria bacterium]|nr:aminodeoxychorismate synthase component I [Gammaproteobacteria bacterium]